MTNRSFTDLFRQAEKSDEYLIEGTILEFTEDMARAMDERGINRSDLARRMDSSPAYITKILRGSTNFTLASMVRIAKALEMDLHVHLAPANAQTRWLDVIKGTKARRQLQRPISDAERLLRRHHHGQSIQFASKTTSEKANDYVASAA